MKTEGIFLVCSLFFSPISALVIGCFYPRFHLAPEHGWMNDPNGMSYMNGDYHMFYQYNPNSSLVAGTAHWGHAKSKDLFHWEHLPIAMYPDQWYDQNGTFSGSAIVENGTMYIFYTGNVNTTQSEEPVEAQYQAMAVSTDGVNVTKYEGNPILSTESHQPDIRDPKVWKYNDSYYMVLGNSYDNETKGQVLVHSSQDKVEWNEMCVLDKSNGTLGYMWECPDFFELNGKFVFLFSPQGMKAVGDNYKNIYQTGYIIGEFDYETCNFNKLTEFRELDHGHDFYATQTMLDPRDRRIVVAWVNSWNLVYPDRKDGWSGLLSIPRNLNLTEDLRLLQTPVDEIDSVVDIELYTGEGEPETSVQLLDRTARVRIEWSSSRNIEVIIESLANERVVISYDNEEGVVELNRGGNDGVRRTAWEPRGYLVWTIYIDASSIELFCGDGEVTFTSRYFPKGSVWVRLGNETYVDKYSVYSMERTVNIPETCADY